MWGGILQLHSQYHTVTRALIFYSSVTLRGHVFFGTGLSINVWSELQFVKLKNSVT